MRVGAATNQAVSVAAVLVANGTLPGDPEIVDTYVDELARKFLTTMENIQNGGFNVPQAQQAVQAAFPGTVQQQAPAPAQPAWVAAVSTNTAGYNTTFSGSNKPLKLAEHPELDGWLHAQCAATGVSEVWDNRGKPGYVTAINSGAAKTPPPFRSATEGIDKSYWPPSR